MSKCVRTNILFLWKILKFSCAIKTIFHTHFSNIKFAICLRTNEFNLSSSNGLKSKRLTHLTQDAFAHHSHATYGKYGSEERSWSSRISPPNQVGAMEKLNHLVYSILSSFNLDTQRSSITNPSKDNWMINTYSPCGHT